MKSSVKLYGIVIVSIIIIGFIILNSWLRKTNEGMSESDMAAKMTIDKLQLELNKQNTELEESKAENTKIQKKIDLLKSQIETKQSEIDRLQDKVNVNNLAESL